MKILHVIDAIGPGGPARSLLALMEHGQLPGVDVSHAVVALRKPAYMPLVFAMRRLDAEMHLAPAQAVTAQAIESADVVLAHFWNTPEIWKFLTAEWPTWRLVHWTKIMGSIAPQLFNRDLLGRAHALIHTAPPGDDLMPDRGPAIVVPGIADFERLQRSHRLPHEGFNALYLGATNPGKLHPCFFTLMSQINIPGLCVTVCGGDLDPAQQAQSQAIAGAYRLEVLPFREDIGPVLAAADVFAYALSPDTYGTSDKSLQEAMFAGLPCVVFRHGGPAQLVEHGETGLIADSDDEFVQFVERLYQNPDERRRLGENARAYARENFAPEKPARRLLDELQQVCRLPKRPNPGDHWQVPGGVIDAARFLQSIGQDRRGITASLTRWSSTGDRDLDRSVSELPDSVFTLEGGLLHWRNSCPGDAALRFWAGLWLFLKGRFDQAAGEFGAAAARGAPPSRCRTLQNMARELARERPQAPDLARRAQLAEVLRENSLPRLAMALAAG